MADDLERWREEFPILERTVYMISNSLGAMPRGTAASLAEYANTWATRGVRAWEERWWEMGREVGDKVGRIIGAPAGSVSMHENVTTAVMAALSCLTPHPRKNRIVCLEADFPSTIYLYRAQEAAGFEVTLVPAEADLTVRLDRILDAIDDRTALVSLSHVLFKTSFIVDPAPVVARAHEVGARVLLDGYQSAGIIPVDVTALGVDHFTGGCLKWLCGGPGTAFLYTSPRVLAGARPRFTGWFAHRAPFAFDTGALEPRDDAMRMMTGTPSIPAFYAALPGLDIIAAVGVDRIRARSMRMTAKALELADRSGLPSLSSRDPDRLAGTIAVNPPDALQVSRTLKARDFVVDFRPGVGIRVSPHFYNTIDEIERLMAETARIVRDKDYDLDAPPPLGGDVTPAPEHQDIRNEQGLARQLSTAQQAMMALGGAIGTGLFLASGLAVNVAGPAVILSYIIVAGISLLLGRALTEMAVAHPTAGAFGVYAGMYVSPFAGYAVRVSYWLMQVIATGGQLVAASIYMAYWFADVPGAVWVLVFALGLIYVNSRAVGRLGTIGYWLVMIKVVAVVLFIGVALMVVLGWMGEPALGLRNLTAHGGFMPFGAAGVWLGCCFVIYSFIGVEIIGITSGEATDPARTIPRAMRRMVLGLSAIYIVTITLLLALTPWNQLGVGESPFVSVLRRLGIPGAAGVMNFVVLTAALSSANANLYIMSRTLYSLSRAGFVPASFGVVTGHGAPLKAIFVSSAGLGAAVIVRALWPDSAYVWFFGVALFGALFVWLMIFVTHIAFRSRAIPWTSCAGAALVAAILISTWWVPDLRPTLVSGGPWLLLLAIGYRLSAGRAVTSRQ